MKIGLQLGYWGAGPDPKMVEMAQAFTYRSPNISSIGAR